MTDAKERLQSLNARIGALHQATPGAMGAFQGLMGKASEAGELSTGLKELVALALAVAKGCEDCIVFHANQAKSHGVMPRGVERGIGRLHRDGRRTGRCLRRQGAGDLRRPIGRDPQVT